MLLSQGVSRDTTGAWASLRQRLQRLHSLEPLGLHGFLLGRVRVARADAPIPGAAELDECLLQLKRLAAVPSKRCASSKRSATGSPLGGLGSKRREGHGLGPCTMLAEPLRRDYLLHCLVAMRLSAMGLDGWSLQDLQALPHRDLEWLGQLPTVVREPGRWPAAVTPRCTSLIPKLGEEGPLGTPRGGDQPWPLVLKRSMGCPVTALVAMRELWHTRGDVSGANLEGLVSALVLGGSALHDEDRSVLVLRAQIQAAATSGAGSGAGRLERSLRDQDLDPLCPNSGRRTTLARRGS